MRGVMPQIELSINASEKKQSSLASISAGQSKERVVRIACPPARRHHDLPFGQERRVGERFPGYCQVYPKARAGTAPRLISAASARSKAHLSFLAFLHYGSIDPIDLGKGMNEKHICPDCG